MYFHHVCINYVLALLALTYFFVMLFDVMEDTKDNEGGEEISILKRT